MAKYDKYGPYTGGTRAKVFAAVAAAGALQNPVGVGISAAGLMVVGAGNTGIIGLFIAPAPMATGDVADIMRSGEIVEVTGLTAGTSYYVNTVTGVLQTGATAVKVGHTVEADRLVVFLDPLT